MDNDPNNRMAIICLAIILVLGAFAASSMFNITRAEAETVSTTEFKTPTYPWQSYGYTSIYDYHNDLVAKQDEIRGATDDAAEVYADVISDEQIEELRSYENEMLDAQTLRRYNKYLDKFNAVIDELNEKLEKFIAEQEQQAIVYNNDSSQGYSYSSSYASNGSGLTKSGGVNWYNGRKETWYSSNVLWHYKTNEWILGSDGVYRDADGYIIVASSDLAYGSVVDTSLGKGKIYDSGAASGVSDIYVAW